MPSQDNLLVPYLQVFIELLQRLRVVLLELYPLPEVLGRVRPLDCLHVQVALACSIGGQKNSQAAWTTARKSIARSQRKQYNTAGTDYGLGDATYHCPPVWWHICC